MTKRARLAEKKRTGKDQGHRNKYKRPDDLTSALNHAAGKTGFCQTTIEKVIHSGGDTPSGMASQDVGEIVAALGGRNKVNELQKMALHLK